MSWLAGWAVAKIATWLASSLFVRIPTGFLIELGLNISIELAIYIKTWNGASTPDLPNLPFGNTLKAGASQACPPQAYRHILT